MRVETIEVIYVNEEDNEIIRDFLDWLSELEKDTNLVEVLDIISNIVGQIYSLKDYFEEE